MQVVRNAKRNIIIGIANRGVLLLVPFIERTAIQMILGSEYLGLDSLFTSIIQVLNLSELGFSSAMVYNMYKPAADGDVNKMNAILNYYKKVYRIIGVLVLVVGLLMIPFLPYLVKGGHPSNVNLTILYLVYLFNTSLSYFLYAYLTSLLVVHQREDVRGMVNLVVKIGLASTQIILLGLTRNYYCFIVLMPVFTIINNMWLAWRVRKLFPQYIANGHITKDERNEIRKLVTGTFIQKACGVTRNSLDSICISAFLGLTLTAIYYNYYLVLNGVTSLMAIFTVSFMGGVGNHVATKSVNKNFEEMKKLDFVYLWIGGWSTICLLCLYQPFMQIWMGDEMLLPFSAVELLCIYFFLLILGDVKSVYNAANGLWWEQRHRAIGETVLNLILNITLGYFWGVYGIIIATIISLFLCNYLWSTWIIFKHYFDLSKIKDYYIYQGKQGIVVAVTAICTYSICSFISYDAAELELIIRGIVCVIFPNMMFYLFYRRSELFKYAVKHIVLK